MQIKTSLNILALATIMLTSIPSQGFSFNPLSENMHATITSQCTAKHALLFGVVWSFYQYNDRQPTKDPSRADWAQLDIDLDGKSLYEQIIIIIKFIRHYILDEVIGHNESKSKVKTNDSGNLICSEAIPGRGMYYEVHRHKDAIIKTVCAPLIIAGIYKMLVANHALMEQIVKGENVSLADLATKILGLKADRLAFKI